MFSQSTRRYFLPLALALSAAVAPAGQQKSKPKPADPRRLNYAEAQALLAGEAEGNLARRPNSFTRTRLQSGQVLELYYPLAAPRGAKRGVPGYGLLYSSEATLEEANRPHHILEEMIPDGQAFVANVPGLVARLEKRLRVGGRGLDYSRASLRRLDAYVAGLHQAQTTANTDPQLFQEITAYYGETLRRAVGGEWQVSQAQVSRARVQTEPNVSLAGGEKELKPWASVFNALYDEERRGTRLSVIFDADLAAAGRG